MALSGPVSIRLPGVSSLLDKLDGQKAKFLSVPANVRAALDKLARVTMLASKSHSITVEESSELQQVKNNLERLQAEWDTSATRYAQLDSLRQKQSSLSGDVIAMASQLVLSAGYVIKNADRSVAAVDSIARKHLTADQLATLRIQTSGSSSGGSGVTLSAVAAFLAIVAFFRGFGGARSWR
jgi:hypothetical protein